MRVAVYIDGTALSEATTKAGFSVDFKRLHQWYSVEPDDIVTFEYYAVEIVKKGGFATIRRLLDYLETDGGYRVRSVLAEVDDFDSPVGKGVLLGARSDILVWLAVELLSAAQHRPDRIVLWSGDRGLARVVEAVQRCGVAVTVVGDANLCSGSLKRAADTFEDIHAIRSHIEKKAAA